MRDFIKACFLIVNQRKEKKSLINISSWVNAYVIHVVEAREGIQ